MAPAILAQILLVNQLCTKDREGTLEEGREGGGRREEGKEEGGREGGGRKEGGRVDMSG